MGSILFAVGYLLCVLIVAGVSVYGFGFVDASWGPSMSFQVLLWLGLAAGLLGTLVHASGLLLFRRSSAGWRALLQGILAGVLSVGILSLGISHMALAVVVVCVASLVAAATAKRPGA